MSGPFSWFQRAWDVCSVPWVGMGEVEARAERRWRALVADARERSPFYRELYRGLPADATLQLSSLPPVGKATLMARFDAWLTSRSFDRATVEAFLGDPQNVGRPFAGGCALWTSSGSTGVPGVFIHDPEALEVYDALQWFRCRGLPPSGGAWPRFGFEGRYAMVAATGGHFAGAASVERLRRNMPWIAPWMRTFSLLQPLGTLAAQLDAYAPTMLATYPTAAEVLADEQQAGRLHLRLSEIWCGGENLSPPTRERLQAVFQAPVFEEYGASEFMAIAAGCRAGWLHVNADWVVLEPVDASMRPVPAGQPSHTVLLTNLANRIQPLIRYDLGDSVTVRADPCPCGNPLPAIRVEGRRDDVLVFARDDGEAVRLMPLVLATVLEDDAAVYDFQLVQTGQREVRLHLGHDDRAGAAGACAALQRYFAGQGLAGVRIDVAPESPRRGGNAKLRRIVHAVDGPATAA
ncbi:MAG TPA: AMP-binding protein [Burkholderiaceae bacterium]|nr:AMP-binding protein [Burkholderiaceae bacterium]